MADTIKEMYIPYNANTTTSQNVSIPATEAAINGSAHFWYFDGPCEATSNLFLEYTWISYVTLVVCLVGAGANVFYVSSSFTMVFFYIHDY